MNSGFQIVVPVYNEEDVLESVLQFAADAGYLHKIVFVDDASTDASPNVLRSWVKSHGINVHFLERNRKKEGAIREVLETLKAAGTLELYTILLDADSLIMLPPEHASVMGAVEAAIRTMLERGLAGIAFRIDVAVRDTANLLELCAFADYSSMQFDHSVTTRQEQVWVINGPGGLFRSELLLDTLRGMQPDFDTGDLLVTVRLMRARHPVAYYPDLQVRTFVPRTIGAYFKQRRRWERGTTKVLWWEKRFYGKLFTSGKLLAIETVIHLSLYLGFLAAILSIAFNPDPAMNAMKWTAGGYGFWLAVNLAKGWWNSRMRAEGHWPRYVIFCAANGVLYLLVTIWARLAGFTDAVVFLAGARRIRRRVRIERQVGTP